MKIWVDDLRVPPLYENWDWCRTSKEAIEHLKYCKENKKVPLTLSLDHDLGGEDTTRPVVLWLCENNWWPIEVRCHSQNPVGREWIDGMIKRYKP